MEGTSRRFFFSAALGGLALLPVAMRSSAAPQLVRTGLWRWLEGTGLERFELRRDADAWQLGGTILAGSKHGPVEAVYRIVCDSHWRTRRADIILRGIGGERRLRIAAENGRWQENGREKKSVRGCTDIDLEWSPSTNTLPIRRLNLAIGQKSEPLVMAWLRFPDLVLEPLAQQYERVAERSYLYTSRGGGFSAKIEVDENGLVVDYEGLWQRVREID